MPCSVWKPLTPLNDQAFGFWLRARLLGPELAIALADLAFRPAEHEGFVLRLMKCASLWRR